MVSSSAARLADEKSAETDGAVSAPRGETGVEVPTWSECFSFFSAFSSSHMSSTTRDGCVKSPSILTGFDGTANQVVGEGSSGVEAESGRVSTVIECQVPGRCLSAGSFYRIPLLHLFLDLDSINNEFQ